MNHAPAIDVVWFSQWSGKIRSFLSIALVERSLIMRNRAFTSLKKQSTVRQDSGKINGVRRKVTWRADVDPKCRAVALNLHIQERSKGTLNWVGRSNLIADKYCWSYSGHSRGLARTSEQTATRGRKRRDNRNGSAPAYNSELSRNPLGGYSSKDEGRPLWKAITLWSMPSRVISGLKPTSRLIFEMSGTRRGISSKPSS